MLAVIPLVVLACTAFFYGRPNSFKSLTDPSSFIKPGRRYLRLVPMPFQYSNPKTTVEKATMRMPHHDMDTESSAAEATLGLLSPDPAFARFSMASSAGMCAAPVKIPGKYYKSQDKEDEMLMQWFGTLCGGTYLELGGLDGVKYSNSYVFNKALGWKGVLIELKEDNYNKMVVNRPDEIAAINAGVCSRTQTLHEVTLSESGAVGGIWEFTSPSFCEQWWKGITLDSPGVREIECNTLDDLLLMYAPYISVFDFLSLDVEGAELSVLESINYDRVQFGIVLVEADEHNQMKNFAMRQFLELKGYTFLYNYARSYWFINDNFYDIYKGLVYQ